MRAEQGCRYSLKLGESKSFQYIYNQSMDNQFINAPLLVNRSARQTDPKEELIKTLQLKNTKLKTELIKIQRAIEQKFEGLEEDEQPRKRESIFQWEDNFEVLSKELANTYKRIKMYEYEVKKLQEGSYVGSLSQKTTQYDSIIKEKKAMSEKLKQQLLRQQKAVQDNNRRLELRAQRDQAEIEMKKLTEEAKFFKEKLKYIDDRDNIKANNMKRQYDAIKKLENTLLESGLAGGELEEIKRSAISNLNLGPRRTIADSRKSPLPPREGLEDDQQDQIADKTKDHYEALLADVALLEKMQSDHEKQLTQAVEDRHEAINKNMNSRNKLLECQNEIQNLQKEIQIMKGKVVPSNMKPLNPLRSYSSHQGDNPQKLLPSKSLNSSKAKAITHVLKYDQVGMLSSKGQRFTDRTVLGKQNLTSKIISVKVYLDRSCELIAGIQCSYAGNKKGGDYVRKDKDQKERQYEEQVFICRGSSFIRSIYGTLNPEDRLESLSFTSSDGTSFKAGVAKTTKKSFTLDIAADQYPVCVFGSLVISKEAGKRQSSLIEHLGFEIQGDNLNSHSLALNQFND